MTTIVKRHPFLGIGLGISITAAFTVTPHLQADITVPPLPNTRETIVVVPPPLPPPVVVVTQAPAPTSPPPPTPTPATAPAAPGNYELPPLLDAATILQPYYVAGPYHTVRPQVATYAGRNLYTIDSPFGVFEAEGNSELVERIAELNAIARLREISKGDQYGKALEAAAKSPVQLAKNLATHPVKTITGVPQGIFKFFNRAGQSIAEATEGRSQSPYEDNSMESLIGFSKAKRTLAAQLNVDPYSSNETFQKELNGIAWAAYAGNMTFAIALAPVGGAAGSVITGVQISTVASNAVRDNSPSDLRRMHMETLTQIGVPSADATAFLNNVSYSPTHQTGLVEALKQMPAVQGRAEFILSASHAISQADALFFERSAHLMATLHATTPLAAIHIINDLPVCQRTDGVLVVPLEWDYACWTAGAAGFLQQVRNTPLGATPVTGHQLVITGIASPLLKSELTANQIGLTEKALPSPLR